MCVCVAAASDALGAVSPTIHYMSIRTLTFFVRKFVQDAKTLNRCCMDALWGAMKDCTPVAQQTMRRRHKILYIVLTTLLKENSIYSSFTVPEKYTLAGTGQTEGACGLCDVASIGFPLEQHACSWRTARVTGYAAGSGLR